MSDVQPPEGIQYAPSPWLNLPVQTFIIPFWATTPILDDAYAPLEAASAFADPEKSGKFKGGLGMMQIVQYRDTPVGAYDELLLVPGYFEAPEWKRSMVRCTRIYVSQRQTCWNGRYNWNIPKHLARFNFSIDPDTGAHTVAVYPHQDIDSTSSSGSDAFDEALAKPFFRARLTPTKWLPSLPFSTGVSKYIGMNLDLAQPPLPAGKRNPVLAETSSVAQERSSEDLQAAEYDTAALCGTTEWRYAAPLIWGSAKACWIELDECDAADARGWWPAYKPWKMGLFIDKGYINFQDANSPPLGRM